jgi:hypothetical protein
VKPIRLSGHAIEQLLFRGTTEDEVIDAISTSTWGSAELGRRDCRKSFTFENIWNTKYYKIKQVRPIFIEGESEIVVVTVYTYFF